MIGFAIESKCVACEHPFSSSYSKASPATLEQEWGSGVFEKAQEQRGNLEPARRILCQEHWENYQRVVEAMEAGQIDASAAPHEDDTCPGCGEAKSDLTDFCETCNAEGDVTAAHYGVA